MTDDQRSSRRMPVWQERQAAVLVLDGQRIAARVVAQSTGGFSVETDQRLKLAPGDEVQLRVADGGYRAAVVHQRTNVQGTEFGLRWIATPDATPPRRLGRRLQLHGTADAAARIAFFSAIGLAIASIGVRFLTRNTQLARELRELLPF